MNRRGFLKAVGTAGILLPAAPAICKAEWLMPVKSVPEDLGGFIVPSEFAEQIYGHAMTRGQLHAICKEVVLKELHNHAYRNGKVIRIRHA